MNWLFSQSRTWTTNVTLWSFLPTAGEKMAIPTCSRSLVGTYRGKSKDRCCPGGTWEVWTGLEEGSVLEAWETFEEKGQGLETHLAYSIWLSFWFLSWYLCHKFVLVFQLLLFLFLIVMEPFFSYWFCLLFFVKLLFSFLVASFCLFCENCTLISVRVLLTRLLIFIVSLPSKTQLEKFSIPGLCSVNFNTCFPKTFGLASQVGLAPQLGRNCDHQPFSSTAKHKVYQFTFPLWPTFIPVSSLFDCPFSSNE